MRDIIRYEAFVEASPLSLPLFSFFFPSCSFFDIFAVRRMRPALSWLITSHKLPVFDRGRSNPPAGWLAPHLQKVWSLCAAQAATTL